METNRMTKGSELTYPASEAVVLTRSVVRQRIDNKASQVGFGTPKLNEYLIPNWAGDLVLVCGRPQNYKTAFIQTIMHKTVEQLIQQDAKDECVVMVTWEVSVEQAMAYWLAIASGISATKMMRGEIAHQWEQFETAVAKVGTLPFYIIGHSTARAANGKRRRPALAPENVDAAIKYIIDDMQLNPRIISMDYLQRIHMTGTHSRNEHYQRCVDWAKDMAFWADCPVFLGTQARREVDEYKVKLPTLRDSQWTSNAEQSADKFFSLWMPKQSHNIGDDIDIGGKTYEVTENLLLLAVAKQKFGAAGEVFALHVEPEFLRMRDWPRL